MIRPRTNKLRHIWNGNGNTSVVSLENQLTYSASGVSTNVFSTLHSLSRMALPSLSSSWLEILPSLRDVRVVARPGLPSSTFLAPPPGFGETSTGSSLPKSHWLTLLGNGLFSYEAQRSGRLPVTDGVSWRNDDCINNGQDVNWDLSELGYYDDAGSTCRSLRSTSNLVARRSHQGHTPARTYYINLDEVARAQGVWQSFSTMQICWGALDHGCGQSGIRFVAIHWH